MMGGVVSHGAVKQPLTHGEVWGKLCKDGTRYDLGEGIGYGTLNFIGGDLAEWANTEGYSG